MRSKQPEPARVAPQIDVVYAMTDVTKGLRRFRMGEPVRRDDPMVRERPDCFEVRFPLVLLEEVNNAD